MKRWRHQIHVEAPGRFTPAFVRFVRRVLGPIARLSHRPTLSGAEHLPATGPYLLVANHSAGMGIAEIISFMTLYLDHVGEARALAGFAHPLSFRLFPASVVLRHIGAIPSTHEAAEAALTAGVPLMVFPGGDHETFRPIWQASRVDFGGRKGFLKIARKMGVPIIPMGIRGSHYTAPVLWRSSLVLPNLLILPRLFGLRRWALTLLGALGALAIITLVPLAWPWRALLAWAWLASPLMFAPFIPWTIRMRIGKPIAVEELFVGDDEALDRALERVQSEVQRLT